MTSIMSEAPLAIVSRTRAKKIKRRFDAILSVAAPGAEILRFHRWPRPAQLLLRMDDIVSPEPHGVLPTREQVVEAIEFARRFVNLRLLIQCEAGVSRSGAFGVAILAGRLGPGREQEALEQALRIAPAIIPNLLIVRLADEVLGLDGALSRCVEAWDAQFPAHRYRREFHQALARQDRHAALLALAGFEKLMSTTRSTRSR
jgi:predicted protein tyrosine phosphatase